MDKQRAVCLNCIDGRVQLPVINWIKDNYGVDFVDMITEPGMDGFLANPDNPLENINKKIRISIEKNKASLIFIAGHHDCQGNAVSDSVHKEHIQLAVNRLKSEFAEKTTVGLWMNKDGKGERLISIDSS